MRRGTTPTLTFNMPFDSTGVENIYITFVQGREMVLEKTLADVVWNEKAIELELTQEETLNFKTGMIEIQLRVKFEDGTVMASDLIYTTAKAILKEGAI